MKTKYFLKKNLRTFWLKSNYAVKNLTLPQSAADAIVQEVNSTKTLVFTVTAGRSGSHTLSNQLSCIDGIEALHEPAPNFEWHLEEAQHNPRLARNFWFHQKLPAILSSPAPVYIETSHMFSKGYFQPALELGLKFNLLCLCRDPRAIALSYLKLRAIPGRSIYGKRYLLSPDAPSLIELDDWQSLTDYQLCYWYVLETEARQKAYSEELQRRGQKVVWMKTEDLSKPGEIEHLLAELGIKSTEACMRRLETIRSTRFNEKTTDKKVVKPLSEEELASQEAIITALKGRYDLAHAC